MGGTKVLTMNDYAETEIEGEKPKKQKKQEIGLMEAYYLGTRTQYLASCIPARDSITVFSNEEGGDLVSCLRYFLNRGEKLDASEHLQRETRELIEELTDGYENGDPPSEQDAKKAAEFSSRWAEAFSDRAEEYGIIHVRDIGFFDINRAIEAPEEFFGPNVWDWIDDESRDDLEQALTTLAADCPTASVMVSLRAVERQLREWHNSRREDADKVDLGPWGHVIGEISDLYDDHTQERPEVLTDLSYMKDRRNEVNHMERSPTVREAEINLRRVQATLESIHEEVKNPL